MDACVMCCAADCRLVLYPSVEAAQKFWIKGDEFTLSSLLHGSSTSHTHRAYLAMETPSSAFDVSAPGCALAIFRLAPADYHRFRSPISDTLVHGPVDIPGAHYRCIRAPRLWRSNCDYYTLAKSHRESK